VSHDQDILFEVKGALGLVRLNRPKALNALTRAMCAALDAKLVEWERDPSVKAVVLRGEGERAFCAGGDVRHIRNIGKTHRQEAHAFFWDEYRMNARIHRFPKPYISLLDGIAMGGGFGISAPGSHRVATPKTLFAMPETGIGMFPDVGGSYFLSRAPGGLGLYLALTGARLGPADSVYVGYAQACVPSERLDALVGALAEAEFDGDPKASATRVIERFSVPAGEPQLAQHRGLIDRVFALDSVEEIVAALRAAGSPFASDAADKIGRDSPTSLKLAHRQIREGNSRGFDDCMRMEWRMVNRIIDGHDFYEGVGALLVDKGRTPIWNPPSLGQVSDKAIDAYFAPLPGRELVFDWD
jgi:enoyl-CoA hydratase